MSVIKIRSARRYLHREVVLEGVLVEKRPPKVVKPSFDLGEGKTYKFSEGILRNGEDEIGIILWGEMIDKVDVGDRIKVKGTIKRFKGRYLLHVGRGGRIEVLNRGKENRGK